MPDSSARPHGMDRCNWGEAIQWCGCFWIARWCPIQTEEAPTSLTSAKVSLPSLPGCMKTAAITLYFHKVQVEVFLSFVGILPLPVPGISNLCGLLFFLRPLVRSSPWNILTAYCCFSSRLLSNGRKNKAFKPSINELFHRFPSVSQRRQFQNRIGATVGKTRHYLHGRH